MYMNNYLITIQYDGLAHKGWQRLADTDNTVQAVIESALSSITKSDIRITGSGRTDAGVSAYAQCANFTCNAEINETHLHDINLLLPDTIRITSICKVPSSFHSRKSCKSKTYMYRIALTSKPDVFMAKYLYNPVNAPLSLSYNCMDNINIDLDAMRNAADILTGTMDYSAFTSDKSPDKSKIRTITDIDIHVDGQIMSISVTGNGFLYNMVRIICGTLLEAGLHRIDCRTISQAVSTGNRTLAGCTLPSNGLILVKCVY